MKIGAMRATGTILAFAALCAGATLSGGCANFGGTVRETRVLDATHVPGAALVVRTANGAVNVRRSEGERVLITAEVRARDEERLAQTTVVAERREDGALSIGVEWPRGGRKGNEGCRFDIEIPGAIGVDIDTGNGAIFVQGLSGEAKLETSNGAIEVGKHRGHVHATSSNGRVVIEECAGDVTARTSNGRVTLRDVGGAVNVRTSNGRVELEQAEGAPGPVNVRTSNGRVIVTLGPRFAGPLAIDTSNGSIDVEGLQGATLQKVSKRSIRLEIGEGGKPSTISTSNGGVVVRRRS